MKVEAHILAFNESETIHLTIKHYQQFCDRIIIYDNFSDDNTRDIAASMGCEVKLFGIKGVLDDKEYLKVKNNCWKGSSADWVIVCDADEILWSNDLIGDLETAKRLRFGMISTYGWNVFSDEIPKGDWLEITTGINDPNYSKFCIFNPKVVEEIGYIYGAHVANPKGVFCTTNEHLQLILFHYKHVGGAQRIADRHALYASRLSDWNKRFKCGYQYQEPRQKTIDYFNECLKKSLPYSQAGSSL